MNGFFLRGRAAARPLLIAAMIALPSPAAPGEAAPEAPAPRAIVAQPRFDFGRIRRGETISHAFRIHNGGNARLAFTGAQLSMPGMTCRISRPLEPGAEGTITVEWRTDRVQGVVDGLAEIATNDPSRPNVALELAGRVQGPLDFDPMPAVFLSTFHGEGVRRVLSLTAHVGRPLGLRLVKDAGAHYRAALEPGGTATAWRLTVEPAPDAPTGRYDESLRIESDEPAIGTVRVPVHLFVKPDLYANPDDLDFGAIPIAAAEKAGGGGFAAQTFFVKKRTGTFRITGLRSDVPGLELTVDPAAGPASSFQIDARIGRDRLAPRSLAGAITILTDDPAFPTLTVRVGGTLVR